MKGLIKISLRDADVTVRTRSVVHESRQDFSKKTRVYGSPAVVIAPELSARLENLTPPHVPSVPVHPMDDQGKPRPHTSEEKSIISQYTAIKRALSAQVNRALPKRLETVIAELRSAGHNVSVNGSERNDVVIKTSFSATAGCSCPCSPGFVTSVKIYVDGLPADIWISPKSQA